MTYDSPKTIRRRQQRAEDRPTRRPRKSSIAIPTDDEWSRHCDAHLACMRELADEGHCDAAGRHARALIHMAVYRRARQIMRDCGRAHWKAMDMAKHELLNCEVA